MNLQQLYYFQTICRLKNYTRAAEQLFVAQSSLSHSISDLEQELGVPLFFKSGRNIDVTEFGKRYLEHVDRILSELELANQEMKNMLDPHMGKIRIAAAHTTCNSFIPNMIKNFCEIPENQNVRFELVEKQMATIVSAFSQREIDLGFGARMDTNQLEYFRVFDEELVAVVPGRHRLAEEQNVSLKELAQEPMVGYSPACGTKGWLDGVFHRFGISPRFVQVADTEKLMAGAVASEIGVAIMPRIPELSLYDVATLTLEDGKLSRPMCMCWPKEGISRPVVQNFRDYVISCTKLP